MAKRKCWKCGSRKRVTRHHVFGKIGLCGLSHNNKLHLVVLLTWLGVDWDDIDIMFWDRKIIDLCRKCHTDFHVFFTKLMLKCDAIESEDPLREFLEEEK